MRELNVDIFSTVIVLIYLLYLSFIRLSNGHYFSIILFNVTKRQ